MKKKIKLTIEEIIKDFYNLGEEEGYLTGLAEGLELENNDFKNYHNFMKNLIDKYLPTWRSKIKKEYWEENKTEYEKGLILSTELYKNFEYIFYQLV